MSDSASSRVYPEIGAGGFTRRDGTIEFYSRINALLLPSMHVVDLGAGRGRQFDSDIGYMRNLLTKPGGWFCARTPNSLSFIALASRLVPNRLHARVLRVVQQGERENRDVFPTHYRMNSLRQIRTWFDRAHWADYSYTYSPEPRYNFGRSIVVRLFAIAQYVKDPIARENLFVFVQKR